MIVGQLKITRSGQVNTHLSWRHGTARIGTFHSPADRLVIWEPYVDRTSLKLEVQLWSNRNLVWPGTHRTSGQNLKMQGVLCCRWAGFSTRKLVAGSQNSRPIPKEDFKAYRGFLSHGGTPSHHPNFNRIFPSKPSIVGYPHSRKSHGLVSTRSAGLPPWIHLWTCRVWANSSGNSMKRCFESGVGWSHVPNCHCLVGENRGVWNYPQLQQVTDDRWYTKLAQTYFSQQDIMGWSCSTSTILPWIWDRWWWTCGL